MYGHVMPRGAAMMEMMMTYEYRVKASTMSVYVECFQEVKEAVMEFIKKNDHGVVYEKIGGKDVIAWRFDPYYGMVRA